MIRVLRAAPVALALLLIAPGAWGEIYRWTDASGRIHFTERIENVPRAHRAQARRDAGKPRGAGLNTYSGATDASAAAGPAAIAPGSVRRAGAALEIPFVSVGSLMRVDAVVNDLVRVPFLVDSGASGVSLPASYASQLGIPVRADGPQVMVSTANGVVARPVVRLDSVQVAGARVESLMATVNPAMDVGLLGGTFFNNYVYSVDAAKGVITLVPNDRIRGGVGPDEWRRRFRSFVDPIERIDAYLRDHPQLADRERERLGARRAELEAMLGELDQQANQLEVPQLWRR